MPRACSAWGLRGGGSLPYWVEPGVGKRGRGHVLRANSALPTMYEAELQGAQEF